MMEFKNKKALETSQRRSDAPRITIQSIVRNQRRRAIDSKLPGSHQRMSQILKDMTTENACRNKSAHLGQDILLCVSEFLDPLEYSTVSRFFLRVAEERAESFLKQTETRSFRSVPFLPEEKACPSLPCVERTNWRRRLGLSVLDCYRTSCEESKSSNGKKQNASPSRKRQRTVSEDTNVDGSQLPSSPPQRTLSQSILQGMRSPIAPTKTNVLEPNVTAPRLMWNRASRIPLAATKGYFQGPSVLLPDKKHLAFFCNVHHQIVVVNASSESAGIVQVVDAKSSIPNGGLSPQPGAIADVRLFCSKDGRLTLFCSHQPNSPIDYDTGSFSQTVEEVATEPAQANETNRRKFPKTDSKGTFSSPIRGGNGNIGFSQIATSNSSSCPTCWFSVWNVVNNDTKSSTSVPFGIQHAYFRILDSNMTKEDEAMDPLLLPPVQDMTVCTTSGNIIFLRYNHRNQLRRCMSKTGLSSRRDVCWIQSFCGESGSLIQERHILPPRKDEAEFLSIDDSKLSVPDGRHEHIMLTLYCTSSMTKSSNDYSSVIETTSGFRHYTFEAYGLNPVDYHESSSRPKVSIIREDLSDSDTDHEDDDEDDDESDFDRFVQHAGSRILYCTSRKRYFHCDPKEIAWTGNALRVGDDGRFVQEDLPNSNMISGRKRWKVRSATGDLALVEDPDEERVVLDEIHLGTGRRLRSISTDVSRATNSRSYYDLDSILVPHKKHHEFFVVLSGLENLHRTSIIFKVLSSVS